MLMLSAMILSYFLFVCVSDFFVRNFFNIRSSDADVSNFVESRRKRGFFGKLRKLKRKLFTKLNADQCYEHNLRQKEINDRRLKDIEVKMLSIGSSYELSEILKASNSYLERRNRRKSYYNELRHKLNLHYDDDYDYSNSNQLKSVYENDRMSWKEWIENDKKVREVMNRINRGNYLNVSRNIDNSKKVKQVGHLTLIQTG